MLATQQSIVTRAVSSEQTVVGSGRLLCSQPVVSAHVPRPLRARLKGRSIKSVKDGEITIRVSFGNQS